MRILFITHYDNMYGANKALCKLIRLLKTEYGHEPMLAIPNTGEMTDSLADLDIPYMVTGVTQWQAEYTTRLKFEVKKAIRKRKIRQEVNAIYDFFKEYGVDLIHSNSSVTGHGAMLAKRFGCKHIWHIREFSKEHYNMSYFYKDSFVKECYESADRLITISDAIKENYEKRYPGASITRVYDGVSGEYDSKATCGDVVHFIYTAYLYQKKHQDEIIEAAKILKDKDITSFDISFAGSGKDDYVAVLKNKINEYELDNVHILGYCNNMAELLSTMDVGLMASEYEGFGLVTVEYMLHGMPVIGFNSGATPEIVEDGITGYIYKTREELAGFMESLINNRDNITLLGNAGRQRALNCFTEEANAKGIIEVYNQVK